MGGGGGGTGNICLKINELLPLYAASLKRQLFSKTGSTHRYKILNLYLNNTLYYYPARENLLKLIRKSDDYVSFICFRNFHNS